MLVLSVCHTRTTSPMLAHPPLPLPRALLQMIYRPTCKLSIALTSKLTLTAPSYPRTGVPGIHVGRTGDQLRAAAIATRQVFSHVEGSYIDFPKNETTDLITNIVSSALSLTYCDP